ncbi:MAG: 50S ribosome-binding GTPase [Candidatus Helarchaeota archaeon]|nr:50S ribosome-binding GTPase [Candidatus Helarchaeota archaeon]
MNSQKKEKIIIVGLDNAGKSTILLTLKRRTNLPFIAELEPTKGIVTEQFETPECVYHCWDFGGQASFRESYLKKPEVFAETDKLIYVIDIQDDARFEQSLNYLGEILDLMKQMGEKSKFSIFLHKFDPELLESDEYKQRSKELRKKLRNISKEYDIPINVYHTTIYTVFQRIQVM